MKIGKFIALAGIALCGATVTFAQTWTQSLASSSDLAAVTSSADGTKLFASGLGYVFCMSTNSGATWTMSTEPQIGSMYGSWTCLASSADGNTLVALNYDTAWLSTNSGATWISNTVPGASWFESLALSADGTKAVAVSGSTGNGGQRGGIYVSTNSGLTWSETLAPSNIWSAVASSADGTIIAAAVLVSSGPTVPVYVSTNSGLTWAPTASPTNMQCAAIASSADGRMLAVAGFSITGALGMLYTSTNTGNTWQSNNMPLPGAHWSGVAFSADGTKLVAISSGPIVTSTNSGKTWATNNAPEDSWGAVTASADGSKLAASTFSNGIWTSQTTTSPTLNLSPANGGLGLSWTIPSTNFVLQQNADLSTTNWSLVTNTPVLNYTNLQYQVSLPASAGNAFFRLSIQ
jgi:hypothetical protein